MEKENQRIKITKQMLKEGLLRLLNSKDLDRIAVTELCKESGINRATFYRHYEIPHDVLRDIEYDITLELKKRIGIPNSREEIELALSKLCSYFYEHADLLRIIIKNHSDNDLQILIEEIMKDMMQSDMATEIVDKLDSEMIMILTTFSVGGGFYLVKQWLLGNVNKTPQEITSLLINFSHSVDWMETGKKLG